MAIKNIEVIPAKPLQQLRGQEITAKLRVCAYCRVSTDNEEQLNSFDAQVQHYTSFIQSKPEWEFVGIYADEGISGTNTKKRVEFNRMIEHCMEGKIDMVITKSISRFARNTVDCLNFARKLKERNIAIFFEKENVNTLDSKGDFMLTLLGSLAQEESNSISQASKQGIVYRFQAGKVLVNHNKFLGYTKDENKELVIDPVQAETVKRIYTEYLEGKSCNKIAKGLERDGLLTGFNRKRWYESTVKKILKNEKYMGDALLQKTYTVDFLTKKRVINEGHVPQYYVENSHPAIVSKEMYEAVQAEIARRSSMRGYSKTGKSCFTSEYPFSGKLFCNNCGSKFTRRPLGSGKHRKIGWQCINNMQNGKEACPQKVVKEKMVERAFVRAMNKVIGGKDTFLEKLLANIEKQLTEKEQEFTLDKIDEKLTMLQRELMTLVRLNAKSGLDTSVYSDEYGKVSAEIEMLRERRQQLKQDHAKDVLKVERIKELRAYLKNNDTPLNKFDGDLFGRLIEKVTVTSLIEVTFVFKTGIEIREVLEG